jgi:hypothetical protein
MFIYKLILLLIAEIYCEKLKEINGHKIIKSILEISKTNKRELFMSLCKKILKVFEEKYPDLVY